MNNTEVRKKTLRILKIWHSLGHATRDFLRDKQELHGHNKDIAEIFQLIYEIDREYQKGKKQ